MREARTAFWRRGINEASQDPSKIWKLERWARLRSHAPPELPKMPPLRPSPGAPPEEGFSEKAKILADRFFPTVTPSPEQLKDPPPGACKDPFPFSQQVTEGDIAGVLRDIAPWKAAGPDGLPIGFLKACGEPFLKAFAPIAHASLQLGHFPTPFKGARVVVIPKPGKTRAQKELANAWRPIALLKCLGKIIETVVARRVTEAAEERGLLPEGQFGNRKQRSTEVAGRFVVSAVRTAWAWGGVASLLQLDLKGAFDTVHHGALVVSLKRLGAPPGFIAWLKSYLRDREGVLSFDGQEEPVQMTAGVPQGSPLSPILFLLFISSLYEALKPLAGKIMVGFADDTNALAFGNSPETCTKVLEAVYYTAACWAQGRGMVFEAQKSELIHFTRAHKPCQLPVFLAYPPAAGMAAARTTPSPEPPQNPQNGVFLAPMEEGRFLGIFLDRKLSFQAHVRALKGKMETQMCALTRLAASTWGCSLPRAREIYVKVIRAAISHGAGVFHNPKNPKVAKALETTQNKGLRTVMGAYRATPIRNLELEAYCAPLDIYLNKRLADFEQRLQFTPMGDLITTACERVKRVLKNTRGRPRKLKARYLGLNTRVWAQQWITGAGANGGEGSTRDALQSEWKRRWETEAGRPARRAADRALHKAFYGSHLRLYEGLKKAHSSILCQARTGKIGLREFLFHQQVPDIRTPICQCGGGPQTAEHLFVDCSDPRSTALRAMGYRSVEQVWEALSSPKTAKVLARALVKSGWLEEYRLFLKLDSQEALEAIRAGITTRPPPERHKRKRRSRRPPAP